MAIFHSDDSIEEGEVSSGDQHTEESCEEEVAQDDDGGTVDEKNMDVIHKEGDVDIRDVDAEVRSSSPPAVWAKNAV